MICQLSLQISVVGTAATMEVAPLAPFFGSQGKGFPQLGGGLMKRLLHKVKVTSHAEGIKP
jgi:hypothetical protein